MLTVYGISNCDKVKKTLAWLQKQQVEYQFHDYKKLGLPRTLLDQFLLHFSHTELINSRGTTWRKLDESVRRDMDKLQAITLMTANPSLIKRPLLNKGKTWFIGFDTDMLGKLL